MNRSNCSNRCPSSGFAGIPAFDAADGVLDLADDEVQFQGGFGFDGVQIGHDDFGQGLSEVSRFLRQLLPVRLAVQLDELPLESPDLRERLDDGQRSRRRARAFQDRREHVEPAFGEGLEVVFGVLAPSGGL